MRAAGRDSCVEESWDWGGLQWTGGGGCAWTGGRASGWRAAGAAAERCSSSWRPGLDGDPSDNNKPNRIVAATILFWVKGATVDKAAPVLNKDVETRRRKDDAPLDGGCRT